MCLLDDKSLVERIDGQSAPLVENLQRAGDWYDEKSPIQASSVDLHIGQILLPDKTGKADGSADCPLELHALAPGQTAIVSTLEKLNLPKDIAAIGFPPSHVSVKGILMTNPGHVDPGYAGPMRFTVINMGKIDYVLRRNNPIVTLLFMKLVRASEKDWLVRRGGKEGGSPTQDDLERLSADFLNVQSRAEKTVKDNIEKANIKLRRFEIWTGLISAVVGTLILQFLIYLSGVQDLKTKVAELEKSLNVTQVQQQMADVDQRLKALESNSIPKPSPTAPHP